MNIFLLGTTRTGKSGFARNLGLGVGFPIFAASNWIKEPAAKAGIILQDSSPEAKREYVEALTELTLKELTQDHELAYRCIKLVIRTEDAIIDGIRNPYDFIRLFNPTTDLVINVNRYGFEAYTEFELDGLAAIESYLKFCCLMHPELDAATGRHRFQVDWDWPETCEQDFDRMSEDLVADVTAYLDNPSQPRPYKYPWPFSE